MSPPFQAILARYDPALRLVAATPLEGGVSASVIRLDVQGPAGPRALVLRRHGAADLAWNPQVAAQEFALLRHLHAAGQPVPEPLFLDDAGDLLPTPYLLQSFVRGDGCPPADPGPALAACLADIHALPTADIGFVGRRADQIARLLQEPTGQPDSERLRTLLRARWPFGRGEVLQHGDFWPGNVIWDAGHLMAVIDWEDAALGDPLGDLGHTRVELLWSHGPGSVAAFTDRYATLAGGLDDARLRLWDLMALLDKLPRIHRWGLPEAELARMRRLAAGFARAAWEGLEA